MSQLKLKPKLHLEQRTAMPVKFIMLTQIPQTNPTNTLWVGAQRGRHLWCCVEFSFLPKSATVGPVQHLLTVTVINVFIYTLSGY